MTMSDSDVKELFREKAQDGTITCGECLALAKELGYPSKKIGPLMNELRIKIVQCQLGCFP